LILVFCCGGAAMAGMTVYSGDTTGNPTWNRPVGTGGLSGVGTAVPYETQAFSVSSSGPYTITSAYDASAGYDGYLHLYAGSFDPQDQFTNLIAGDDDYMGLYGAQMAGVYLTGGTNYIIVNSGFDNADFGAYTTTICGCGDIQLGGECSTVPAPGALGLVAAGCLSVLRRRRR
jgi:uncharacterized protein (TIGR03382 family)